MQRFCEGFHTFCPDFHQNKSFECAVSPRLLHRLYQIKNLYAKHFKNVPNLKNVVYTVYIPVGNTVTWQAAVNAVALLSTVGNVALEKNVQGIWRVGLNWSACRMRPAGRSLATLMKTEEKWWQHTPLSEFNTNGKQPWFISPDTDTNFWGGTQWLDGQ